MVEDVVKLNFELAEPLALKVGDYIIFNNVKYSLYDEPKVTTAPKKNEYECNFYSAFYELKRPKMLLGFDYTFDYTGNAADFLLLCVNNMNRDLGGYTVGSAPDTEVKTLLISNKTVLEFIQDLKKEFGIEVWLNEKQLNFTAFGADTGYTFKVGRFQGLYNLSRKKVESTNIITKLWVYGSDKNLAPDYDSPLLLKRLAFENADLNNESRLEKNVALYGVREDILELDDIKPERTGTITAIDADDNLKFTDNTIDFDVNEHLLPGLTPKVNFISGALMGITFDLSYDHASKTFTVDAFTDESGTYPNATLKFTAGDKYKLFDISLPATYVSDAKARLRTAGQAHLEKNCVPQVLYSLDVDESHIRRNAMKLKTGDYVTVSDTALGIDGQIRIVGLKQSIVNPDNIELDVGELLPTTLVERINNEVSTAKVAAATSLNTVRVVERIKADTSKVYDRPTTDEKIANSRLQWR
jgi:hypothetical protein